MEDIKISIVTPNYNYAQYIDQTIESVLNQDYDNIEYIIVDDGSTDNSIKIIKRFLEKYPTRLILIQQENQGQTSAINKGLQNARGEILGWINSDDTYCANVFSKIVKYFIMYPETDIIYGDINIMNISGNFIYRKRHLKFSYYSSCFNRFTDTLTSNSIFWRRRAMLKSGYLKNEFKCNMDGEFFSRLTKGMNVAYLHTPIANFRRQLVTKAAENNPHWNELMLKEHKYERLQSYSYLPISKYLPYKYAFPLKLFYRLERIFLRTIKLHYFKKWYDLHKYKKKRLENSTNY